MSDTSITRILDAIDGLRTEVAGLKVSVTDLKEDVNKYNAVKDRTFAVERDIQAIQENCARVQAAKASKIAPWKGLLFGILGAAAVTLVNIVIDLIQGK